MAFKFFKVKIGDKTFYFLDKKAAKKARDNSDRTCIVMRGPDHWRGETYGPTTN